MKTLTNKQEQYLIHLLTQQGLFDSEEFNYKMEIDQHGINEYYDMSNLLNHYRVFNRALPNKLTLAHLAATLGQKELLEHFLDHGALDTDGFSLLHAAIIGIALNAAQGLRTNSIDTINLLLQGESNVINDINQLYEAPNQRFYSALSLSIPTTYSYDVINPIPAILTKSGAKLVYTELELLHYGVDKPMKQPIKIADQATQRTVGSLIEDWAKLHELTASKKLELYAQHDVLNELRITLGNNNFTKEELTSTLDIIIGKPSYYGYYEVIMQLINLGVSTNSHLDEILNAALGNLDPKLLQYTIDQGVSLDSIDGLHTYGHGAYKTLKMLINNGANINYIGNNNECPNILSSVLKYASNKLPLVKLLLESGVDINFTIAKKCDQLTHSNATITPLEYILEISANAYYYQQSGNQKVIELLSACVILEQFINNKPYTPIDGLKTISNETQKLLLVRFNKLLEIGVVEINSLDNIDSFIEVFGWSADFMKYSYTKHIEAIELSDSLIHAEIFNLIAKIEGFKFALPIKAFLHFKGISEDALTSIESIMKSDFSDCSEDEIKLINFVIQNPEIISNPEGYIATLINDNLDTFKDAIAEDEDFRDSMMFLKDNIIYEDASAALSNLLGEYEPTSDQQIFEIHFS